MKRHAVIVWAFCLVALHAVQAAELVTLSPANYRDYVPDGKEVDAVFGDYCLRNDRIVAVVADPSLMVGRSGSRKGGVRQEGCIIDLALRDAQNDLLQAYDPALPWPSTGRIFPQGMRGEPHNQGDFVDSADAWKLPGREPVTDARVVLRLPFNSPVREVRYTLEDGWDHVLVETVYTNATKKPLLVKPAVNLFMGPAHLTASPAFLHGSDENENLSWIYDPWFGQAYGVEADGVAADGVRLNHAVLSRRPSWFMQRLFGNHEEGFELPPGTAVPVGQRLFPGRDALDVRARIATRKGARLHSVAVEATAPEGPVADADLALTRDGKLYGAGRTGADGRLALQLPEGDYVLALRATGRGRRETALSVPGQPTVRFDCDAGAYVEGAIGDDKGRPIPCKVAFHGRGDTRDPFFFTIDGESRVRNLVYSHTGRFRQAMPPGDYDVVVTHGPEYDAVFTNLHAEAGRTAVLACVLKRSVDTTGWVSAEFASRSTASRSISMASQKGRVLNLLAEHIEFAPATEADMVSDFAPHLEELDAGDLMATCPGIGLTQRTRKCWTSQNVFPVRHVPGAQDGGALQRPQHVLHVFWVGGWYGDLTVHGGPSWSPATDKLIQLTPPGIWRNDGRSDGMDRLFYPRRHAHESVHRNGRLSVLHYTDAMDVQPLSVFLDLPAFDPRDPKADMDMQAWWDDIDRRRAERWPDVGKRNREWPRILNLGYRIAGVVNNRTRHNYHGSGLYRNFVKSPTDDPGSIQPLDIVHAVRFGHVTMTTGPFLEVELTAARPGPMQRGIPGDDVAAPGGEASLRVRVQCPNWIDVDRVQVLFNGMSVSALNFTRATHADLFADGVVKFDRRIPLQFAADTHVIVAVGGSGPGIRHRDPENPTMRHVAVSNPVRVDVNGGGFDPQSPLDDAVYTLLDVMSPLRKGDDATPARVLLYLKNLGAREARDSLSIDVNPEGAAVLAGGRDIEYVLAPGEQKTWELDVSLAPGFEGSRISLHIPRSSAGAGRRAVGAVLKVDATPKPWTEMSVAKRRSFWWLPEHVSTRPPDWGASRHAGGRDVE